MKANIINRTTKLRKFTAGGRYLTLAGGEIERNVQLSQDEADALNATGEFHVREIAEETKAERAKDEAKAKTTGVGAAVPITKS